MISSLPLELTSIIVGFLDISSKFSLSRTCRKFTRFLLIENSLNNVIINSITNGYTEIFVWLINRRKDLICHNSKYYCTEAAKSGSFDILKYIYANELLFDAVMIRAPDVSCAASMNGHFDILKWLLQNKCRRVDDNIFSGAAIHGRIDILEYLLENGYRCGNTVFIKAAASGQIKVLEWFRTRLGFSKKRGCKWNVRLYRENVRLYSEAAINGHLEVVKWLYVNGCPYNRETGGFAASNGHINILEWILETIDDPWRDTHACSYATKGNQFEILKWLRMNGCPWNRHTCENAAQNNNLKILKWLHENGCPWDHNTCYYSARNGNLNMLKYLHENGCPWNEYTCLQANTDDYLDILKYLHKNGCPWNSEMYDENSWREQAQTFKYLRENGCPES